MFAGLHFNNKSLSKRCDNKGGCGIEMRFCGVVFNIAVLKSDKNENFSSYRNGLTSCQGLCVG